MRRCVGMAGALLCLHSTSLVPNKLTPHPADDDDMLELQPSPSQKAEDKRFIRVGSSRSEDGSPRSTWEDQGPDEGLIGTQQSRSEDGCPQASWENQPQGLSGTEEPHSQGRSLVTCFELGDEEVAQTAVTLPRVQCNCPPYLVTRRTCKLSSL